MSDIKDRLEQMAGFVTTQDWIDDLLEAAAEIARLRERIKGHAQDGNELIRLLQKEREQVRVRDAVIEAMRRLRADMNIVNLHALREAEIELERNE